MKEPVSPHWHLEGSYTFFLLFFVFVQTALRALSLQTSHSPVCMSCLWLLPEFYYVSDCVGHAATSVSGSGPGTVGRAGLLSFRDRGCGMSSLLRHMCHEDHFCLFIYLG